MGFVWHQDGSTITAEAKITCKFDCGFGTQYEPAVVTLVEGVQEQTCYQEEIKKYRATYSTEEEVKDFVTADIGDHLNVVPTGAKAPTCTNDGNTAYYHCTDCDRYFSDEACTNEIALDDTVIEKVSDAHVWGDKHYEVSDDKLTINAYRICEEDETHIQEALGTATFDRYKSEPTQYEAGKAIYNYVFDKYTKVFSYDPVELDVPALGHTHTYGAPTYTWSLDHKTCTAKKVCTDEHCSDMISQTVDSTSIVSLAPKCETKGKTTYTATFNLDPSFVAQVEEVEDIPALGHLYEGGVASYDWGERDGDVYHVTASISCQRSGCDHVLEETKDATIESTTPAACEEDGNEHFSVSFTNKEFTTQTKDDPITATGHSWGSASYNWATDKSTCTAHRECDNCDEEENEEVDSLYIETQAPTCSAVGSAYYHAEFENTAFEEQDSDPVEVAMKPHSWGSWTGNTATCTDAGQEHRECAVCHEVEYQDTTKLGHSWGNIHYEWLNDYTQCRAYRVCTRDGCDAVDEEIVDSEWIEIIPQSCTPGKGTYIAHFTRDIFQDQETDELATAALGHIFTTTYRWTTGSENVRSDSVCERDSSHTESNNAAYLNKGISSYDVPSRKSEITDTASLDDQEKNGDINIFFSNVNSDNSKGRGFHAEISIDTYFSSNLSSAKDNFILKFDNGYHYHPVIDSYSGGSYVLIYSDLTASAGGTSEAKRGYSYDTANFTDNRSDYGVTDEEFWNDFKVFASNATVIITADYTIVKDSSDEDVGRLVIKVVYNTKNSNYSDYVGYTQQYILQFNHDDVIWGKVNAMRLTRTSAMYQKCTMSVNYIEYSENINYDIMGTYEPTGWYINYTKTTIVDVLGCDGPNSKQ